MTAIRSHGIHRPSALPLLIAEGILPPEPDEGHYTWRLEERQHGQQIEGEEELLWTKRCVVWSIGGFVQKFYRFDVEKEIVSQALFAYFPETEKALDDPGRDRTSKQGLCSNLPTGSLTSENGGIHGLWSDLHQNTGQTPDAHARRALVVLLETQAHIYLDSGTTHVVNLPSKIARAFSLSSGIILQPAMLREHAGACNSAALPLRSRDSLARSLNDGFSKSSIRYSSNPDLELGRFHSSDVGLTPALQRLGRIMRINYGAPTTGLLLLREPQESFRNVYISRRQSEKTRMSAHGKDQTSLSTFSDSERLFFISQAEKAPKTKPAYNLDSLICAVSYNLSTSAFDVFLLLSADSKMSNERPSQPQAHLPRRASTRRSSLLGRRSLEAQDKAIGSRSRASLASDITDEALLENVHAGSGYDSAAADSRKGRRISSLLARMDAGSSTQEIAASVDMHEKLQAPSSERREKLLRLSLKHTNNATTRGLPRARNRCISSVDSTLLKSSADLSLDPSVAPPKTQAKMMDTIHSSEVESPGCAQTLHHISSCPRTFRTELGFSHELPDCHAFTLRYPQLSEAPANEQSIILCIMDREEKELLIMQISASSIMDECSKPDAAYDKRSSGLQIQCKTSRKHGIIDARPFTSGTMQQILVLEDQGSVLTLQAPWSALRKIELPTFLNKRSFKCTFPSSVVSQPETQSCHPSASLASSSLIFERIERSTSAGRFDLVDSAGRSHRFQVNAKPRLSSITKIVDICNIILPSRVTDAEQMLRVWQDASQWLKSRLLYCRHIEWFALLIPLIAAFTPTTFNAEKTLILNNARFKGTKRSCISSDAWTRSESWAWMVTASNGLDTEAKIIGQSKKRNHREEPESLTGLVQDYRDSNIGKAALGAQGFLPMAVSQSAQRRSDSKRAIKAVLHLLCEESALHRSSNWIFACLREFVELADPSLRTAARSEDTNEQSAMIAPSLHQIRVRHETSSLQSGSAPLFFRCLEKILQNKCDPTDSPLEFTVSQVAKVLPNSSAIRSTLMSRFPRITFITECFRQLTQTSGGSLPSAAKTVVDLEHLLNTLPESAALPIRILLAQKSSTDIQVMRHCTNVLPVEHALDHRREVPPNRHQSSFHRSGFTSHADVHSLCHHATDIESVGPYDGSAEVDRQTIMRLVFRDDQRFSEAAKLLHPLQYPVVQAKVNFGWTEQEILDAQQELSQNVAFRTLSVSLGRGLLFHGARIPLMTEKFTVHGFTLSCFVKPSETTVTADRSAFTEEKVSWAFFHAGVEAGLTISRDAAGIDTSWILFNKPRDLTNRHAGFLFALGLNGHLKSIAKWVAFKYLTPKHNMTSLGLLLGLSASHVGTGDTLVTRLLSVHVTRMLPPGSAELNLNPLTQTCGMMGLGLLYFGTQHRRMTEIMLSEIETVDEDGGEDVLRNNGKDEGYRLATGFGLGFINAGMGNSLQGLHDMKMVERLLSVAIAAKAVNVIHIADRSTAAAIIALSLTFMKTNNHALAQKIDVPDTVHQFDFYRPDHFLLRTTAKHLILWDAIEPHDKWFRSQMPPAYQESSLNEIQDLTTEHLAWISIIAGLCLSIGLRFAGSGSLQARDLLCRQLDPLISLCKREASGYDSKAALITIRNCQDVIALSAACIMAGRGDLIVMRRLRSLHGRTSPDIPFGSHLAAHFALGILFAGGGTYTFGTSTLAISALLCAFYPLFPASVLDNTSHLQAFRHFWVLAIEERCLVPRDALSHAPLSLTIELTLKDGTRTRLQAPSLLPDFSTIESVAVVEPDYWPVFQNVNHDSESGKAFRQNPSIYVQRKNEYDVAQSLPYTASVRRLNDEILKRSLFHQPFDDALRLKTFSDLDGADRAMVLPFDSSSESAMMHEANHGTVLDDWLTLDSLDLRTATADTLRNLRLLFALTEYCKGKGIVSPWLRSDFVRKLQDRVALHALSLQGS